MQKKSKSKPTGKAPRATPQRKTGKKIAKQVQELRELSMEEPVTMLASKWNSLFNRAKGIKTESYNMRRAFETETAIDHKTLGWGYIIDKKNDRLEVLFKDGIKYLISNYK